MTDEERPARAEQEDHRATQGWMPDVADENELLAALEEAFDYRGDVTITRKDGTVIEGYLFDRRSGRTLADSQVRVLLRDSEQRVSISYADVARLQFSGRDTAAGKSFETWIRKYVEKKRKGEAANLYPDSGE